MQVFFMRQRKGYANASNRDIDVQIIQPGRRFFDLYITNVDIKCFENVLSLLFESFQLEGPLFLTLQKFSLGKVVAT